MNGETSAPILSWLVRDAFGVPAPDVRDVPLSDLENHLVAVVSSELHASDERGASLRDRALAWVRQELPGAEEHQRVVELVPEHGRLDRLRTLEQAWQLRESKGGPNALKSLMEPSPWRGVGCLLPYLFLIANFIATVSHLPSGRTSSTRPIAAFAVGTVVGLIVWWALGRLLPRRALESVHVGHVVSQLVVNAPERIKPRGEPWTRSQIRERIQVLWGYATNDSGQ